MGRVVHFEIHADDPKRAIQFYSAVFGWVFRQWEGNPYWLIETGPNDEPGINGGLTQRQAPVEGAGFIAYPCTIDVADIDASIQAVQANGGGILSGKQAVPGVGWLAYAKDTEGNIFGMMQDDSNAG